MEESCRTVRRPGPHCQMKTPPEEGGIPIRLSLRALPNDCIFCWGAAGNRTRCSTRQYAFSAAVSFSGLDVVKSGHLIHRAGRSRRGGEQLGKTGHRRRGRFVTGTVGTKARYGRCPDYRRSDTPHRTAPNRLILQTSLTSRHNLVRTWQAVLQSDVRLCRLTAPGDAGRARQAGGHRGRGRYDGVGVRGAGKMRVVVIGGGPAVFPRLCTPLSSAQRSRSSSGGASAAPRSTAARHRCARWLGPRAW